jgi:hypothetical protein
MGPNKETVTDLCENLTKAGHQVMFILLMPMARTIFGGVEQRTYNRRCAGSVSPSMDKRPHSFTPRFYSGNRNVRKFDAVHLISGGTL